MLIKINPKTLSALDAQVQDIFDASFENAVKTAWWDQLATKKTSGSKSEIYEFLIGGLGLEKLPEGEMIYGNLVKTAFEIVNGTWGKGLEISREDIADSRFDLLQAAARRLGAAIALNPQTMIIDLIKNGETALGYDGVPFFSNAHPVSPVNPGAGTYDNLVTGSPLNAENLAAGIAYMQSFVDATGNSLHITPKKLVVPPTLAKIAVDLTGATYLDNSDNVYFNSLGISPIVIPELSSEPDAWYLAAGDAESSTGINPFIYQVREDFTINTFTNVDSFVLSERDKYAWHVRGRVAAAYGNPFQMIKFTA